MNLADAALLAFIEGITEYLPVSSTGHMILASTFLGIESEAFTKLFTIAIQLGAILSVLVLYTQKFLKSFDFYLKLLIAFLPAAFFGLLFNRIIDQFLESPLVVAISLLLGGIVLVKIDDWFKAGSAEFPSNRSAFTIGLFQCLAMVPGVSRSAASIIGGMTQKMSRKAAAEFSFFLAVPTMFGATAKKSYDFLSDGFTLSSQEWQLLVLGNVVAFVVGVIAIKGFINYLNRHGFKGFGYYRIVLGLTILFIHFFIHPLSVEG